MPRTLGAAVNSGWAVIGAAAEEGAVPLSELKVDGPTVLVMGESCASACMQPAGSNLLGVLAMCCDVLRRGPALFNKQPETFLCLIAQQTRTHLPPLSVRAGNEGYGVRPLVKRLCTQLVQIEMESGEVSAASRAAASHRLQLVDSLNVSVATGILLHHMLATAKTQ